MKTLNILLSLPVLGGLFTLYAGPVRMTLTAPSSEVVLGQPIVATLSVRNDSAVSVRVWDDKDLRPITVTSSRGEVVKSPPVFVNPDHASFGTEIKPGTEASEEIAITDLAFAPAPGHYTVTVSIPEVQALATLDILVQPYDAATLDGWAKQTTDDILSTSDAGHILQLAKALGSVRMDISEPYVCRVLNESRVAGVPIAVDSLRDMGTIQAARCLIAARPAQTRDVDKQYINSALRAIRNKTPSTEVRKEIEDALTPNPQ